MADSNKRAMRVFISYRRDDNAGVTGRIYDRLVQRFGRDVIFKDIDSIPLGINFRHHLDSTIKECDVVLVVIGDKWMMEGSEPGRRRIDDPKDFVRIEIESALQRNIPVIPLLVQKASIPDEGSLPPSLRELAGRNGITIGNDPHFHVDVDRLIKALETHFETACPPEDRQLTQGGKVTESNPPPLNRSSSEPAGVLRGGPLLSADRTENAPRLYPSNSKATKFTWVMALGYVAAVIIGMSFVGYVYKGASNDSKQIVSKGAGEVTAELVTREDLITSLKGAKTTILAAGFALDMVDSDLINDRVKKNPQFRAAVILVNPLDHNVICMRQQDEKNDRAYGKILLKLRTFHGNSKNLLGNNLILGVTDTYPTMSVIIVDDDLYAYFFPYRSYGTTSPVLKFKNHLEDARAKFFYDHYQEVFKAAHKLTTDADYQPYETADLNFHCPPSGSK